MRDYNRTLWENNKTVIDAESLNNIEDQLLIITGSMFEDSERMKVIEDTLPMKANINHTHDDLATTVSIDKVKSDLENSINIVKTDLISSINTLKAEIQTELKKYYDHAEIEDNILKLYSNNVLLTSLTLPVLQNPAMKSICGEFLCGDLNCDDFPSVMNEVSPLSYDKTIWQDGVTPVNAANLNKIENKLLELSNKITELSEQGFDLADNIIHTGATAPTTTKGLWIDNSDEDDLSIANPLVEQFAEVLSKHQEQINQLFYLTDAYLDDGLFEEENITEEEFDGGEF